MGAFTLGKLGALWVYAGELDERQWALMVVVPCCAFYILSLLFVRESPRYWIDNNIAYAEQLLRRIA
jgi:hypothetical protein